MKISLNWINDYIKTSLDGQILSDSLTNLGLENTYNCIGTSFKGVIVGKIIKCINHENSDHLKICKVDLGKKKFVQIVCGAPNVISNIYVPIAKVGATLNYGSFEIKKTKIRGVESFGMICSEKELGISDNHLGIMILQDKCRIGQNLSEILNIKKDAIFEIDLTPNRGDCLSHIGVAREISLLENKKIQPPKISLKEISDKVEDYIDINIDNKIDCPNYQARIIKNVSVGVSPKWLVDRLNMLGQKSINNIVDAANYVMFDLGQPLHTFDYDKISDKKINVRLAKNNERVHTLDGNENALNESKLVISDNKKVLAVAGIIGCESSCVTEKTKNILLESAIFNPILIRKGSKELNISTEASKRFERGVDFDCVGIALDKLSLLISDIAGGDIVKGIIKKIDKVEKKCIQFGLDNCNNILGDNISKNTAQKIFDSLSIKWKILNKDEYLYECSVPSYRNDLEREIDLIEEIARVFGYNNISPTTEFSLSLDSFKNKSFSIREETKNILSNIGFNEHYSNSLINRDQTTHFSRKKAVKLLNPQSLDMQYVRNSLLPGLLKAVAFNQNRQSDYFKLFEVGSVSYYNSHKYNISDEQEMLGLALYGTSIRHWKNTHELDIFEVKSNISLVLEKIGLSSIKYKVGENYGSNYLTIFNKKKKIGKVILLSSNLKKYYKIKGNIIVAEINLEKIKLINLNSNLVEVDKYPFSQRDLSILVSNEYCAQDLINTIKISSEHLLKDIRIVDIYSSQDLGLDYRGLTFSLIFQSSKGTLVDKEIEGEMNNILKDLKQKYKITQR